MTCWCWVLINLRLYIELGPDVCWCCGIVVLDGQGRSNWKMTRTQAVDAQLKQYGIILWLSYVLCVALVQVTVFTDIHHLAVQQYSAFLVDGGMFPCGSFRGMLCGKRRLTSSGLMCMVQMCKSCCVAVRFNTTTTSYEAPSEFVVENLEHFLLIETSWSKITPLDISRRLMELRNWWRSMLPEVEMARPDEVQL